MVKQMLTVGCAILFTIGCIDEPRPTSDDVQRQQQEVLLKEGTAQVGMPNILNFRERKEYKDILELRDQADFPTFTYTLSDMTSKLTLRCHSVGYAIPYATQFTNPSKVQTIVEAGQSYGHYILPQADPNGLFSPASAEGTWVLCKNPRGPEVKPVYFEPRVIVSPFELLNEPAEDAPAKK